MNTLGINTRLDRALISPDQLPGHVGPPRRLYKATAALHGYTAYNTTGTQVWFLWDGFRGRSSIGSVTGELQQAGASRQPCTSF
jgi:hypothetical protein